MATVTSWNPLGHPRPVTGLLYLFLIVFLTGSYKKRDGDTGMDCIDMAQDRQLVGSCESGNGLSGSLKLGKSLD